MIQIDFAVQHPTWQGDPEPLRQAIAQVLADHGVAAAVVSVAIVDDPTIHRLNKQFLAHDEPTDVLSFVLQQQSDRLEGEIIVSADTAQTAAARLGWPPEHELLLYAVHGALHLVGYDDLSPGPRRRMRSAEREYLARLGIVARWDDDETAGLT